MNTCDTCRHWKFYFEKRHTCGFLNAIRHKEEAYQHGAYTVGSLDDDRNDIETGPKFGCVHHQEKEPRFEIVGRPAMTTRTYALHYRITTGGTKWAWFETEPPPPTTATAQLSPEFDTEAEAQQWREDNRTTIWNQP